MIKVLMGALGGMGVEVRLATFCARYVPQFQTYYDGEWRPCVLKWAHHGWRVPVRFPARTNNIAESHFRVRGPGPRAHLGHMRSRSPCAGAGTWAAPRRSHSSTRTWKGGCTSALTGWSILSSSGRDSHVLSAPTAT